MDAKERGLIETSALEGEMSSAAIEVQREIAARLEKDGKFGARSHRSASEQGPHPGYHLWGTKRSRKRTSAPQMGVQPRTALILRSRRSWPVAPVASSRWVNKARFNTTTYRSDAGIGNVDFQSDQINSTRPD